MAAITKQSVNLVAEPNKNVEFLLNLEPTILLNPEWFTKHIPDVGEVVECRIDPTRVIWGRMATVFFVELVHVPDGEASDKTQAHHVVVKRVVPSELNLGDQRIASFVASAQAELEYYKQYRMSDNFPKIYASYERQGTADHEPGFLICMEDLTGDYHQTRSVADDLSISRALTSLADMVTSTGFETFKTLCGSNSKSQEVSRACFWPLERRPLDELETGPENWLMFIERFKSILQGMNFNFENSENDDIECVKSIGQRLANVAKALDWYASQQLCSVVHGDAKNWNMFHPNEGTTSKSGSCKLIDLQWTGIGHPLQDFLYFMTTSVDSHVLEPKWNDWLAFYRSCLMQRVDAVASSDDECSKAWKQAVVCDSMEEFRVKCDLLWLDYARVVCFGLWRKLDPERQQSNANRVGISLVTASVEQMCFIINRIHKVLGDQQERLSELQVLFERDAQV